MSNLKIRRASVEDAEALADLAECTFRETFSDSSSASDMDLHCANSFNKEIQSKEINNPNYVTLLAEEEGELIGFSQLLLTSGKDCVSAQESSELYRLYIRKEWHRKRVSHALMEEVLRIVKSNKSESIWLGVWENNDKAIKFYQKYGFEFVGEHIFQVGDDPQRDLIMALSIDVR